MSAKRFNCLLRIGSVRKIYKNSIKLKIREEKTIIRPGQNLAHKLNCKARIKK